MDLEVLFDSSAATADLSLIGPDLALDKTLKTAVLVSLFTDRQAHPDDRLPDDDGFMNRGSGNRRGWWGDHYAPEILQAIQAGLGVASQPSDRIGSRLWLLAREKQTAEVLVRARGYAEEALAWLVEDGIADRVVVAAEYPQRGRLALEVDIYKPTGLAESYRFDLLWQALAQGGN